MSEPGPGSDGSSSLGTQSPPMPAVRLMIMSTPLARIRSTASRNSAGSREPWPVSGRVRARAPPRRPFAASIARRRPARRDRHQVAAPGGVAGAGHGAGNDDVVFMFCSSLRFCWRRFIFAISTRPAFIFLLRAGEILPRVISIQPSTIACLSSGVSSGATSASTAVSAPGRTGRGNKPCRLRRRRRERFRTGPLAPSAVQGR